MDVHKINEYIHELQEGPDSWASMERLASLYTVRDHMCREEGNKWQSEFELTKADAEKWVANMRTADGKPVSQPWTMEQAAQVLRQRNWPCDPVEFWAIMVALWADHCAVARKYGVDNVDFWADMAKSWLDDADAEPDKAWRYYKYIAKS